MINEEDILLSKLSYTDKDFANIYPDLVAIAKQLTNKWDPSNSNESDPGVVLLKEGAFIADHLNYNIDKNILEAFLPSATQETSVRNIVEMNGYTPRYYVSAYGDVNISYNPKEEDEFYGVTLAPFSAVVHNELGDKVYTIVEANAINSSNTNYTFRVMEGTPNTVDVNGSNVINLENLDDNNRVYINNKYVASNGIFICNDGEVGNWWTKNNYLLTQPVGSKVYKLDYDSEEGLPYIEFPSDIATLIGNGLNIIYLTSTGSAGSVVAGELNTFEFSKFISTGDSNINVDYFKVNNPSAINNGLDPETINEMYASFKKVVGTFDTLVTARDYSNAINSLEDNLGTKLVSNAVVTDSTTDYNKSLNVVTFDRYGSYIENSQIVVDNGELKTHRLLVGSGTADVGDIYYNSNKFYLVIGKTSTGSLQTKQITEVTNLVEHIGRITPYDINVNALKAFSMNDFSSINIEKTLNKSFTKLEDNNYKYIREALDDYKCITHNIVTADTDEDIICFKNYVPLNVTVTPYNKVTKAEKEDIRYNIIRALTENFNASKLEFGEELSYDAVLEVIENADARIKSARLNDFEYTTKVLLNDGFEYDLDGDLLVDLVAKNVLAGRLCLFDFEENIQTKFGQVSTGEGSTTPIDVTTITSVYEPDLAVKEISKAVTTTTETFGWDDTVTKLQLKLSSLNPEQVWPGEDNGKIKISAEGTYELPMDGQARLIINPVDDAGQSVIGYPKLELRSNYFKYVITNNSTSEISINIEKSSIVSYVTVNVADIEITKIATVTELGGNTENGSIEPSKNEHVQVVSPSYYSDATYGAYVYYRFDSTTETDSIPANSDYTLQPGQYVRLSYSADNVTKSVTYKPGDVIRSTFSISVTSSEAASGLVSKETLEGATMQFASISSGQSIEHRVMLESRIETPRTPIFWIRDNASNTLFAEGETWTILNPNEYLVISNVAHDSIAIFGQGTIIKRPESMTEEWTILNNGVTIGTISKLGQQAGLNWKEDVLFSKENYLSIIEADTLDITNPDKISLYNWTNAESGLDNEWKPFNGYIKYSIGDKEAELPTTELGYYIRTRLDINTDNIDGQPLTDNSKIIIGSELGSKIYTGAETIFKLSEPIYMSGGENINVAGYIGADKELYSAAFKEQPVKILIDGSAETVLEPSGNKYAIDCTEKATTVKLPFNYFNNFTPVDTHDARKYIFPIFIDTEDSKDIPLTISLVKADGSSFSDNEKNYALAEYNSGVEIDYTNNPSLSLSGSGMHLVELCRKNTSNAMGTPTDESATIPTAIVNEDLMLKLSWGAISEAPSEVISIYEPVIVTGLNNSLTGVSLNQVLDRITYLVSNSSKPSVKPFYINTPDLSMAIQGDETSSPESLWDYNNVANRYTIAQIDIPNSDIDVIKSMRKY